MKKTGETGRDTPAHTHKTQCHKKQAFFPTHTEREREREGGLPCKERLRRVPKMESRVEWSPQWSRSSRSPNLGSWRRTTRKGGTAVAWDWTGAHAHVRAHTQRESGVEGARKPVMVMQHRASAQASCTSSSPLSTRDSRVPASAGRFSAKHSGEAAKRRENETVLHERERDRESSGKGG